MSEPLVARRMGSGDEATLTAMRLALWPHEDATELAAETPRMLRRTDYAVFGARDNAGAWIGFVEVGARDVAEGCTTSPVGYIEGLWVSAGVRRRGVARILVRSR